jgi:hypothetical protein
MLDGAQDLDGGGSLMGSKQRLTTFTKLNNKGELGVVLGRLMLAMNDIGIANDALAGWMGEQAKAIRADRQRGAKMYFVRMLISHVFEALLIVGKIRLTPVLRAVVDQSAAPTREAFERCANVIGTAKYKQMKDLRSGLGFHYLDQPVRDAIASQVQKAPDIQLALTVGHNPLEWYYEPGDRIVDSAVVRGVFQIPEGADVQKELDKLINDIQSVGDDFVSFAGYFVIENAC